MPVEFGWVAGYAMCCMAVEFSWVTGYAMCCMPRACKQKQHPEHMNAQQPTRPMNGTSQAVWCAVWPMYIAFCVAEQPWYTAALYLRCLRRISDFFFVSRDLAPFRLNTGPEVDCAVCRWVKKTQIGLTNTRTNTMGCRLA